MPENKPRNKPAAIRHSENWPTSRAKAKWRRLNRARIAREAQQQRNREADQKP